MRMVRYLVVLLVLGMAGPALLLAQSISVDTPTPPAPSAGSMKHILNLKNLPNVNTGNFAVGPADTGVLLAKKGGSSICSVALSEGWTITPVLGCAPATGAGCCATLAAGADGTVIFTAEKPVGTGFLFTKLIGDAKFSIAPSGAGIVLGVNSQTNAGNNLGQDLLPNFLVQVLPNGVNGVVTFRIFHTQGGLNPRTFPIDTGTFTTLTAQAHAIRDGFNGAGLTGLTAVTRIGKLEAELYAANPQEFIQAPFTHVIAPASVTEIQVDALPGQIVIEENNAGSTPVPALSPWGVFALVLTILLASLWFLRRRARMAQA